MTLKSNQSPLQQALFQAAKVGNINLMREFILIGANPFAYDEINRSALSYSMEANPEGTKDLLYELDRTEVLRPRKGGENRKQKTTFSLKHAFSYSSK